MLKAPAHSSEPRAEKAPTDDSAVVPAQEAHNAIRKAFPCDGILRLHHLWSAGHFARFRANWFREADGKTMIVKSLLLGIEKTVDGLVVRDETVV